MPEDWFRTPDWDDDAREGFERRLARARAHNKPQYLRVKAIALRDAGDHEHAEDLFERIVREYWSSLDATISAELLGDLARDDGRPDDAIAWYRACIEKSPSLNATTGEVHIALAEVLNGLGDHNGALVALDTVPPKRLTLNSAQFRWNAALAESALGVGEADVAREAAQRALAVLDVPDQFSRHPGVGRPRTTEQQVERLKQISRTA